ncbi:XdhC family protein [Terrihabitans rhizophilus]|uniref:XdhC family protein n=1 Tax=Terrihabitans rhizophilus TaxID=3092662 RepID=A0ABU4RJ56_9HYPH|nr:XdhC family protein [Terrihabitans sp. PJ23]MDX6804877.1 XdhC family protein [Terrihabitans sp. PJ23]
MKNPSSIFRFLLDASSRRESSALVTITGVRGGSSRELGAHMAVSETGATSGSVSSGCVERVIVGEAQRVIASGQAEILRFGVGSRYLDVRLPCGGSLDLLVTPHPADRALLRAIRLLEERRPATLQLSTTGEVQAEDAGCSGLPEWSEDTFTVTHSPLLRLCIIGGGQEVEALVRLAKTHGAEAVVLSPDAATVEASFARGALAFHLESPSFPVEDVCDSHTAVVTLFHDHSWEPQILAAALGSDALFVGAMGSASTQHRRLERLQPLGVPADRRNRLAGPIGLVPGARDPDTLAVSILAQAVAEYEAHRRASRRIMARPGIV